MAEESKSAKGISGKNSNDIGYTNIKYYNAGAGSGKTHKLTHILADEIKKGVDPSQVIMTTFTVDASSDLRERSRSVLYEEGLFSAAARMDQALIGTVHSIGQRFISKYWYQLGLSPSMKVMDEISTKIYIDSSLANLPTIDDLKLFDKVAKVFSITTTDKYNHKITNRDFWKEMLKSIIENATAYRIDSLEESLNYSLDKVRGLLEPRNNFSLDKSPYMTTLKEVYELTSSQDKVTAKIRAEKAKELLESNWTWDYNDFIKLYKLFDDLTKEDKQKINGINIQIESLEKIFHSFELFDLIEKCIRRIFSMADQWRTEYQDFKKRNSIIDYHDMEQYFLEALDIEEVMNDIRSSYRCLMVDEFQDSNQVQVQIFSRLSELIDHCYWCGDSKQAIYGFRGADTELTRSIVQDLQARGTKQVEKLPKSYRSLPKIVNFCNMLFPKALSSQMSRGEIQLKKHRKKKNIPQIRVFLSEYSSKDDFYFDLVTVVKQLHLLEKVEYKDIAILNMQNKALDIIAEELLAEDIPVNRDNGNLLTQREIVLLQNILTLVVDPTDELAKTHIYHLTRNCSTLDEIIDMRLEFLSERRKALEKEKQNDRTESETSSNSDSEKSPKKESEKSPNKKPQKNPKIEDKKWLEDTPLVREILQQQPRWRNLTVTSLIRCIILELNLRAILKSWGKGWEKREHNLFTLIDIASQYEQLCNNIMSASTVFGFINYLKSQGGKSYGDLDGVHLQTFHSSKGLEWKYVILTSLEHDPIKSPVSRNFCGVNLVRLAQPSLKNLFPKSLLSVIPDIFGSTGKAFSKEIYNKINEEEEYGQRLKAKKYEWARLLYVAVTRAADSLILATFTRHRNNPTKGIEMMGLKPADTIINDTWDLFGIKYLIDMFQLKEGELVLSDEYKAKKEAKHNKEENKEEDVETASAEKTSTNSENSSWTREDYEEMANSELIMMFDLPKKTAPEGGYKKKFVAPSQSGDSLDIDPKQTKVLKIATAQRFSILGNPEMNLVGDCIHNAYACFSGDDTHDRQIVESMIDGFGLQNSLTDSDAIVRSHRFLTSELIKRHGHPQNINRETEFIHQLGDQIVKGSIDLVWDLGDKVVIVDYKTFPGSIEDTLNPESHHYAGIHKPQLEHYRLALTQAGKKVAAAYIYYPVLQHLVEVN